MSALAWTALVVLAAALAGEAIERWLRLPRLLATPRAAGIVESMKDFYWDVRPKPEFGTIEIRVCDTPLTVERAAALAGYAQALARRLLAERPALSEDAYLAYTYNRFQACRFGLEGELIDAVQGTRRAIAEDVRATLGALGPHAHALGAGPALAHLEALLREGNDARLMRAWYADSGSLADVVWRQVERLRAG